ncbi:MAG: aminotransferase class V-fold PLP-dependent enzyme [Chloroflexota bacterium]
MELSTVEAAIGPRTKVVAITGASNILGTKPPLRQIADAAHANGALLWVDGVHYAAHEFVDPAELRADVVVCSACSSSGPTAASWAPRPRSSRPSGPTSSRQPPTSSPSGSSSGTLPYELLAGVTAAVDFIAAIAPGDAVDRRSRLRNSFHAIDAHELAMRQRIEAGLADGRGVVLHCARPTARRPYITLPGRRTADAAAFLVERNVQAPASHFYGWEPWQRLHLDDEGLRMGVAPYTNDEDVDRLLAGLAAFLGA